MHLLINPFCFPHIVVRYGAKRICPADQLIEVHSDAVYRIYQGKEVCMGSLFDWTIQHHLPNQSGSGEPGSFAKVIEPLSFLLVQHDMNINRSSSQSLTSDQFGFVTVQTKTRFAA